MEGEQVAIHHNKRLAWTSSWGSADGAYTVDKKRCYYTSSPINAPFGNMVLRLDLESSDGFDEEKDGNALVTEILEEYKSVGQPMVFLLSPETKPSKLIKRY